MSRDVLKQIDALLEFKEERPLSQLYDSKQLLNELEEHIDFLSNLETCSKDLSCIERLIQCEEIICLLKSIEKEKNHE